MAAFRRSSAFTELISSETYTTVFAFRGALEYTVFNRAIPVLGLRLARHEPASPAVSLYKLAPGPRRGPPSVGNARVGWGLVEAMCVESTLCLSFKAGNCASLVWNPKDCARRSGVDIGCGFDRVVATLLSASGLEAPATTSIKPGSNFEPWVAPLSDGLPS